MKKIILLSSIIFAFITPASAFASTPFNACKNVVSGNTAVCSGDAKDAKEIAKNIISVLLWIVGMASIIVIVYSGITFVTSAGNPSQITRAKTMLLYAVVGLVVSILAYAIVNFIVENAGGSKGGSSGSSSSSSSSSGSGGNSSSGSGSSNKNSNNNSPNTKSDNSSGSQGNDGKPSFPELNSGKNETGDKSIWTKI
jgi:hypothetical protein cdivTM_30108